MISELVCKTRTVRRFQEEKSIASEVIHRLIDLARFGGSARNAQSLKYMVITDTSERDELFPLLAWAGYLPHWAGPEAGERPSAYIICLLDNTLQKGPETEAHFDLGIATQNMLLGAAEAGIYGCRIGAFSREKIKDRLSLPERYTPLLVVALGYPAEEVVIEEIGEDGDVRYWHDEHGVHHVPKRRLEVILLERSQFSNK
nr:nitroreductase family protein [uncultured Desulfobulbus sp.]